MWRSVERVAEKENFDRSYTYHICNFILINWKFNHKKNNESKNGSEIIGLSYMRTTYAVRTTSTDVDIYSANSVDNLTHIIIKYIFMMTEKVPYGIEEIVSGTAPMMRRTFSSIISGLEKSRSR